MNTAMRRTAVVLVGLLLGLTAQLALSGTASAAPAPGEISPKWAGPTRAGLTWAGPTATTAGTNWD